MSAPGYDLIPITSETVTTTNTSNLVTLTTARAGTISIGDTQIRVVTQIDNDTVSAVLQLLYGSTELGTITLADSTAKGKQFFFTPVAAYTADPYIKFSAAEDLKVKVKTAGTDASSAAGAVEVIFAVSQPER